MDRLRRAGGEGPEIALNFGMGLEMLPDTKGSPLLKAEDSLLETKQLRTISLKMKNRREAAARKIEASAAGSILKGGATK